MDVGVNRTWTTLWLAHSMITLDRGLGIRRGVFPEHWERMSLRCGSMDDSRFGRRSMGNVFPGYGDEMVVIKEIWGLMG